MATLDDKRQRIQGFVAVALSSMGFGLLGIFGKAAFARGLAPGEYLSLRFVCASVILIIGVGISRPRAFLIGWRAVAACAALGLIGNVVFCSLFFEALNTMSASLTVLIFYCNPLLIALGGWWAFDQKPGVRTLLSLPVVSIGLLLLVGNDLSSGNARGALLSFIAACVYAVDVLASSRWLRQVNPIIATTYILSFGGLGLTALNLKSPDAAFASFVAAWPLVVGVATVSTVLPMVLLLWGLRRVLPAEVGLLSTVEPITGVVVAQLFLGERLAGLQLVGACAVLAALVFMAFDRPPAPAICVDAARRAPDPRASSGEGSSGPGPT